MKKNFKKYAFEFLSIFIAVISAFALNNWNDNRRDEQAQKKILDEISNGLEKDIEDVELNVQGHAFGLKSNKFWRKIIMTGEADLDSLNVYYFNFLRDFISIQNTSGYENLKSRGLELIKNDSLRTAIISLYEYDYKTLKTLEEEYFEMQFHENYYKEINDYLAPSFRFDTEGSIVGIELPIVRGDQEKNKILSYLWKIDANRKFALNFYKQIEANIINLKKRIESEKR
ncbi:hypothetical protein FGM00_02250 [Aggregatimonas sangjinii]|uniref:Uncharacterized protein n=1 Tax=Aggregatimonas sangjinii TaxID=2583587 RepID=A0A5B7SQS0_9FLAO|nr:hypothetical protein [Aggregatimonas sangjinii]QCW98993.1 hypothetical protein FGM00_02250 [Aggregatimonas sangjinii]